MVPLPAHSCDSIVVVALGLSVVRNCLFAFQAGPDVRLLGRSTLMRETLHQPWGLALSGYCPLILVVALPFELASV